jgi:hypothetical protein
MPVRGGDHALDLIALERLRQNVVPADVQDFRP